MIERGVPLSNIHLLRNGLLGLSLCTAWPVAADQKPEPQYVIISFDGAGPIPQWERSRALASRTGAEFTYFLSCVYLLTREDSGIYQGPGQAVGDSNVGFGESREDVVERLGQIWAARKEGHEIASHGCGHFDGGAWSAEDWQAEFDEFREIVAKSWQLNGIASEPAGWREFVSEEIIGFRAPYLSTGEGLFQALEDDGFAYDASTVSKGSAEPVEEGGVVRFALPMIPEGPEAAPVIAMDYNLFARHSDAKEVVDERGVFEQRTLDALRAALHKQMTGERIPLQIGYHFTLMNGGAYWRALERFATEACAMAAVSCVSYETYLEETAGKEHAGG